MTAIETCIEHARKLIQRDHSHLEPELQVALIRRIALMRIDRCTRQEKNQARIRLGLHKRASDDELFEEAWKRYEAHRAVESS